MLRRRWPILLFAVWTIYVWTTRILNAWTASDESTVAKSISTVVAVLLLGGAIAVALMLWRARHRVFEPAEQRIMRSLAVATALVWAVRIPQIALDGGREVPFKIVHLVLAGLSLLLAALTWRVVAQEATAGASSAPDPTLVSPGPNADR